MKTTHSTPKALRLLLAAGLLFSVAGSSLAQQTLYTSLKPSRLTSSTGNDGGFFTTGSGAVLVSHIGYYSTNTVTGLNVSHAVGLFTSGTPYVAVATNTVPAGTSAYYYNNFYWVQFNPPVLLAPNTKYYLWGNGLGSDGDWWLDEPGGATTAYATWNSYFVGSQGTGTRACMWSAGNSWPPSGGQGGTGWCLNRYKSKAMIGNLPAGQAEVLYTGPTNLTVNGAASFTLSSYAVGQSPTYQWWFNGAPIAGATATSYTLPSAWDTNAGTYYFTATNTVNGVTSGQQTPDITVSVILNPVIQAVAPPTSGQTMTLYAGANATFAITTMAGASPFSYQWFTNGVVDPSGTSASYSITNVQSTSPTTFTCIVTNVVGAATNTWTMAVVPPPTQAYPVTVLADAPIGYWRLNEADNNANNGNFNVVANDYWGGNSGVYSNTVLSQTGYGSGLAAQYGYTPATDSETSAQFGNFPSDGPTNSFAGNINGVSFAASAAKTNAAFSVEAWVNGATTQVSGAGIVTKGYGNGGEQFDLDYYNGYRFLMRDAAGGVHGPSTAIKTDGNWHHLVGVYYYSNVLLYVDGQLAGKATWGTVSNGVLSSSVPLSIGARRSASTSGYDLQFAGTINDVALYNYALSPTQVFNHYAAAGIAAHVLQNPVAAVNLNYGDTLALTAASIGTPTVTNQWYDITTGLPVANQTNVSLVISNVDSTYSGHTLALKTSNDYGQATSSGTFINVYTNPVFTLQPVSALSLYQGSSAIIPLTVATIGPSPIGYNWYLNGVLVASTTNGTVSLTNPQSGTYTCQATNALGSTTGGATTVSFVPAPTAPYPAAVLTDHPMGYWRLNESDNQAGNTGVVANDYWGGNYGFYTNTVLGQTGYSQGLATQSGASSATELNVTSANFGYYPGYPATSNYVAGIPNIDFAATNQSVAFSLEAWAKGDYQQGTLGINGGAVVAKGDWAAEQFTLDTGGGFSANYAYRITFRDAKNGMYAAYSTAGGLSDGNWHHLVGVLDEANSNLCLYVDGVKVASTLLPTATNGVLSSAKPMSIGSRLNGTYKQQFFGNINDVAVYNYALSSNQVVSHYLAAGIVPRFTLLPPAYTNVNEGTTLSVPVQVLGSLPMSYQWYDMTYGSPTPVPGQTSPTLVIPNISQSAYNGHMFALTAVNSFGQATTSPGVGVNVQAGPPTSVTVTPGGSLTRYAGQALVLTATAQGSQPFSYQWSLNNNPINGATSSAYTNMVTVDTYVIGCTVANAAGTGYPAPATVNVTGIAAPTDSYAHRVLTDQPVAYWRLDEGNNSPTAYDYVGGHNAGYYSALTGVPGFNPVTGDTAAEFGSGFAYYSMALEADPNISGVPNLDFSTQGDNGHFSIELWVNAPAGQNSSAGVITKGYGSNNGEQFNLDVYTGGHYRFFVRNAAGTASYAQSPNIGPDGTWHHLVAVCDQANGQVALYVDGALNATGSMIAGGGVLAALPVGAPVPISIGSRMSSATDYNFLNQLTNAVIDEVAIYDYALSSDAVAAHYAAAGEPPVVYGQPAPAAYAHYEGFPVQYTVAASGAAPLAYQWRKNSQPIAEATTSALNIASAVVADTGAYDVVVTNTYGRTTSSVASLTIVAPSSDYENVVLANGALNYWRLNETNGTIAYDYLGGLNGTYGSDATNGVPGPADPLFAGFESNNTAVAINATVSTAGAGYVTAPTIPLNTNTVTMTCWVYPFTDITTYQGVVYCGANPLIKGLAYVPASGLNCIGYTWNSNAANTYGGTARLPTPPRQWSFVALTIAPNQAILYVGTNGVLRAATNNIAHDVEPFNNPTCIGADPRFAPSSGRVFNGELDEVAVYGTTLSGAQVADLYSAAVVPPEVTLTVQRSGTDLLLGWPNGTLMAAPTLDGPWTNVPNATPPSYLVKPTDGQLFYRVRVR